MADKNSPERRRRSSSILQVYHEPPETLEQISDQASLPNLNANWTNAKGTNMLDMQGLSGFGDPQWHDPVASDGPRGRNTMLTWRVV